MISTKFSAVFLSFTFALTVSSAEIPSSEELLQRIQQLEEQVKLLTREREVEGHSESKSRATPTVVLGSRGLEVRSTDTNVTMRIHAHIQADGRFFPNNASSTDDTFLMRRVRPIIDGTLYGKLDYRLMLDFGSGLSAAPSNIGFVQEAFVNARFWPEFQIQVGKFKEAVGLERSQPDVDYLFIERAFPTQLVPNRDVGVQVQGTFREAVFSYGIGLFNGVSDGGSGDIDTADDDKDVAARFFAQPFFLSGIKSLQGLGFGIAGTYGHHAGPLRGYLSPGQQAIFSYYAGSGTNALTTSDGNISRLVPQAYYYFGPFGLLAEYALSSSEVTRVGGGIAQQDSRLQHSAWQVSASFFLTGETNGWRNPVPRDPVDFHGGGWGGWELIARVHGLKLDAGTFPIFADPKTNASEAMSYGAGVNWHLNKNFKLSLDYEHTNFKGGNSNRVLAQDEDAILSRAQIAF